MNWFTMRMVRRVGDGMNTSFWNESWCLGAPLFVISNQKDGRVGE